MLSYSWLEWCPEMSPLQLVPHQWTAVEGGEGEGDPSHLLVDENGPVSLAKCDSEETSTCTAHIACTQTWTVDTSLCGIAHYTVLAHSSVDVCKRKCDHACTHTHTRTRTQMHAVCVHLTHISPLVQNFLQRLWLKCETWLMRSSNSFKAFAL